MLRLLTKLKQSAIMNTERKTKMELRIIMVYDASLNNQIPVMAITPFLCPAEQVQGYVESLNQHFPDCRISTYPVTSVIDLSRIETDDYWVFEREAFDRLMGHLTKIERTHPSAETRAQMSGIINRLKG